MTIHIFLDIYVQKNYSYLKIIIVIFLRKDQAHKANKSTNKILNPSNKA